MGRRVEIVDGEGCRQDCVAGGAGGVHLGGLLGAPDRLAAAAAPPHCPVYGEGLHVVEHFLPRGHALPGNESRPGRSSGRFLPPALQVRMPFRFGLSQSQSVPTLIYKLYL